MIIPSKKDLQNNAKSANLIYWSDCDFTEDAVTKALDKIKVNKTPDPDCIALGVLKEMKYQITNFLQYYSINP